MNRWQKRKLTRQEPDPNPNARLLWYARTGSLLAYRAIRASLRERVIGERVVGERVVRERVNGKRVIGDRVIWERVIGQRDIMGEGHLGEVHWGDCYHMPICWVAAAPHRHPSYVRLAQLLAELAPLGEVVAASQAPKTPAHWEYESPVFVVMGEAPGFVAVWQVLEVVAVGYNRPSTGHA